MGIVQHACLYRDSGVRAGRFVPMRPGGVAAGLGPVLMSGNGGPAYAPFANWPEMGATVLTLRTEPGRARPENSCAGTRRMRTTAGIVTADCDGQHTVKSAPCVRAMESLRTAGLSGLPYPTGPDTPAHQQATFRVIGVAMRVLYNDDLKDMVRPARHSERDARGPAGGARRTLQCRLNMLIYIKAAQRPYSIVPIETGVYFNNNEGSHCRHRVDSAHHPPAGRRAGAVRHVRRARAWWWTCLYTACW